MNIKKLFAILAGVSMVANVALPGLAQAATPDNELGKAYEWAYSKGITTMDSFEKANMYGNITRAEMSKMLSVYAKTFLGKTADTSKECKFSDIDSVKGDLHDYIIESCQLGIMGQNITAFRPYDTLSRAEFGTALSRALWGDKNNTGTPYYAAHLNALKEAGIMNQINNADSTKEIRGYVMIMLQRASGEEDKDLCEMCLATGIGEEKCEAVCGNDNNEEKDNNDEVVKSGSLVVSSSAADDRSVVVASGATAVSDLDTLTFATSEEVTISKVTLEKYGYSSASDLISNVWLENEDGKEISNKATPNSKGLVNLTLKKDYKTVDGKLNAVIVVETKANAKVGGTVGFKVTDVASTAKNVDLGNYKAYTYDVVAYDGTKAKITAKWWSKDYNYEGKAVEISKFKIKAPDDSSIDVTSFTLTNTGTLDIYDNIDVDDVEVTIDGETVKANISINKDEEMTVSLKDSLEIAAKQQVEVIVSAKFNNDFEDYGSTVILRIASASDLSATDKNNARITVDTASAKWVEYVINGGEIKLTNTKLGNVEASINSTDILIASGYITVGEDIEKGTIIVTADNSGAAIESMTMTFAGDDYDATPSNNKNTWTFTNVEASESGKIRLYVDIDDNTAYENATINFSIELTGFVYSNAGKKAGKPDISGTLTVSKLTITQPEGSLINNLSSSDDVEFTNNETNTEIVFDGTYTADKQDIELNSFSMQIAAYTWASKIKFYLYVDDMESSIANVTVTSGVTGVSDTFKDVLVEAGKSVRVKVEAEVKASEAAGVIPYKVGKFNLILEGEDENDNDAGHAERRTANMVIVNKGSVSISDSSIAKAVLRKASSAKIAEFTVKPDGANSVSLESISFDLTFSGSSSYQGDVDMYVGGSKKKLSKNGNNYSADFTTNVESDGVVVYVEINDEYDGSIKLTNLLVNGKSTGKEFDKKFVDAIVWFTSQSFSDSKTTFKFGIDKKKDSTTISNVVLTLDGGATVNINELNEIKAWVSYDVINQSWAKNITAISFDIDAIAATAASCSEWTVSGTGCNGVTSLFTAASCASGWTLTGNNTACLSGDNTTTTWDASIFTAASCSEWTVSGTGCNGVTSLFTAGTSASATPVTYDSTNYPDMFRLGMKEDGDRVYVEKVKN